MSPSVYTIATGLAALAGAVVTTHGFRRERRQQTYQVCDGSVTAIDPDSSSETCTIEFSPSGELLVGGKPHQLRAGTSIGTYKVGESVPVYYDPADPSEATRFPPGRFGYQPWLFLAVTLMLAGISLLFGLVVDPMTARRNAAARAFVDAVRRADTAAVKAAVRDDAQLDQAFLNSTVRQSTEFKIDREQLGFDATSCVKVQISGDQTLMLYLTELEDGWKVARAAPSDPECEQRIEAARD